MVDWEWVKGGVLCVVKVLKKESDELVDYVDVVGYLNLVEDFIV